VRPTNHMLICGTFELLRDGLLGFFDREMPQVLGDPDWFTEACRRFSVANPRPRRDEFEKADPSFLLNVLLSKEHVDLRSLLGKRALTPVHALARSRNDFAHFRPFSDRDAYAVMLQTSELLALVGADVEERKLKILEREIVQRLYSSNEAAA